MYHLHTQKIGKIIKPMLLLSIFLIIPFFAPQSASAAGWDLTSLSFSQSFSVASQEDWPTGIDYNNDGTKMFVVGITEDNVNEYSLSTGFDVSTASFTQSFSAAAEDTAPNAVTFNGDGTKMFVLGNATTRVYQYTLSTGFSVTSAGSPLQYVLGEPSDVTGLTFNGDGTKMFIVSSGEDSVFEYALSPGFSVTSASYTQSFSAASQEAFPQGVAFSNDGTQMFIIGFNTGEVHEYALSTGFSVTSASFTQTIDVSTEDSLPYDLVFNSDGTKMFIVGESGDAVYEYSTPGAEIPEFSTYIYILTILMLIGLWYKKMPKNQY